MHCVYVSLTVLFWASWSRAKNTGGNHTRDSFSNQDGKLQEYWLGFHRLPPRVLPNSPDVIDGVEARGGDFTNLCKHREGVIQPCTKTLHNIGWWHFGVTDRIVSIQTLESCWRFPTIRNFILLSLINILVRSQEGMAEIQD